MCITPMSDTSQNVSFGNNETALYRELPDRTRISRSVALTRRNRRATSSAARIKRRIMFASAMDRLGMVW